MQLPRVTRAAALLALLLAMIPVAPAHAVEFDVEVGDFYFAPDELFVNAGDTVTWTWVGEQPHNVTPVEEGAFQPSETQIEGTHTATFEEEGSVRYFCTLHASPDGSEGMVGTVNVLAQGEPLPEPPPEPRPAPQPGTLEGGEDAIATALAFSGLFADGSADTVLLGRVDVFADSLASGGLQGLLDAPLLLTPSNSLDPRVEDEIARLGAQRVIILGGTEAISADVEAQLAQTYTVERAAGATRVETAIDIARTYFPDARSAFLVRSDAAPGATDETQAFADSLAVGGAAAREAIPILLSQTSRLTDSVREYLQASQIRLVHVVGGTAALADQVVTDLEALQIEVVRIDGATRFDTALNVAFTAFSSGPPEVAILIEGQAPDAWVAGFTAASAAESAAILLANGENLPVATLEVFSQGQPVLCAPGVAPAACEKARIAATATPIGAPGTYIAVMTGGEEVPPGAEDATGDFALLPTEADDAICYEIAFYNLDEPLTAAHIHTGGPGEAGEPVIPLSVPQGDGDFLRSCAFDLDPAVVADVLANPGNYYVNYHTESHQTGAIRGQLFAVEFIGAADLSAAAEVPPSEASGGGIIFLFTDAADHSRVCYFMGFGIQGEEPTAAHIHEGGPEETGDPVIPLGLPPSDGEGGFEGSLCVEDVDTALVEDLLANPGGYYVNVHTDVHPDGAIRGQIANFASGPPEGGGGEGGPAEDPGPVDGEPTTEEPPAFAQRRM